MSIQDAIAAAKAKAAEAAPQSPEQAMTQTTAGNLVPAAPAATPARMTASSFLQNARVSVDAFLKVNEFGLSVGTERELINDFDAEIKLSEVQFCQQIRFGNPVQYYKTYDGVTCTDSTGRSWLEAQALAKRTDPSKKTDPFMTADLVIRPVEDVKGQKTGKVMAEAGTVLGHTPSYTGVEELSKLLKAVAAAGGDPEKAHIRVRVSSQEKTNKNGNNWGVVTFEFKGLVAD